MGVLRAGRVAAELLSGLLSTQRLTGDPLASVTPVLTRPDLLNHVPMIAVHAGCVKRNLHLLQDG
jgi:hypothetical protein